MWISLALFSALLLAVRRIYEKKFTLRFGNFSLAFALQIFSILPTLALFLFLPIPDNIHALGWQFWGPLLIIWIVILPIQTYFLYRSLREGELSEVTPVSALLPVFNIFTSFFIIHELPSSLGATGILATVLGTYLLLTDVPRKEKSGYNRPVLFMLCTILCMAIGSTLDKVAISASTPVFYSFVNISGSAVVFLVMAFISGEQKQIFRITEVFWTLCGLGIILALAFVAFTSAFALGPTSYTLAIRSGGFLVATLWGVLFLQESLSKRKVSAILLFIVGTIFLAVG
jgi:drug/metabolite transporter (DMT)-like permease